MMEVYRYAEQVQTKGFVFMDSPGFDPVSATGQIAGGANLIAFTTGRGSCFGAKRGAVDQAGHQHANVHAYGRGHGRQLR